MITRRKVVAGAVALAGMAPRFAFAQGAPLQFRISTASAEQDWLSRALVQFKENVERDLPGQIAVSVHANSSLFRQGTELPAIQRGNLEMSTMTTFEIEQQMPEFGVFSSGYVFRDYDHMRKVMDGPIGQEFTKAVADKMGVQIIDFVYLGTRQVNLRQAKDVKTPADLGGVKLRMPPGPGWVALARGLGVTPTPMAMPEVYLAMKSGAIDGQENPLAIARFNNLHEVSQQFVLTAHLVQPVAFAVAKPVWDKLSPAQQQAMKKHARAAAEFNDKSRLQDEKELVEYFKKAGLKVTEPDIAAFKASVDKQYQDAGLPQKWQPGLLQRIADTK
ncbi:MAG: DctP family TRAP transporter solute-binding subunit [Pseudorhodoplanes sp.]